MEIRGALHSDIVKYMIDVPAYQDLMNDKAVTEMAKKLSSPEARQKFFAEGQEMSIDTLNADALEQEYQQIAQPAAAL